ncbi:MAG TPA: hypothetical protein PLV66_02450 [Thermoanaerobaculales bacterium]|nr:hypothetical protein [Thermoanaerobaculales bacterium]
MISFVSWCLRGSAIAHWDRQRQGIRARQPEFPVAMSIVRRIAVLLVIAAMAGIGPAGAALACPSGAAAHGCCCDSGLCGCEPPPAAQLAAPSCGCNAAAPTPAVPASFPPTTGDPGTGLTAIGAHVPTELAAPAPLQLGRDGSLDGRTPSGPLIYLIECALLI